MRETSPLNFQRTLLLLGRLALGVVFLYAAYAKLSPAGSNLFTVSSLRVSAGTLGISISFFAVQIDSFRLLPLWAVNALAHTLPFLELLLGLLPRRPARGFGHYNHGHRFSRQARAASLGCAAGGRAGEIAPSAIGEAALFAAGGSRRKI